MTSQTFRLTAPGLVRHADLRSRRPPVGRRGSDAPGDPDEGTSVLRLVGVALLGWFGLMTVVAIVSIY